ncbi:MAG: hypothetical protein GC134_09260 [Proteobacteria bacterium]|nr:hypothetical protein [Pseudomonadota bacterium]
MDTTHTPFLTANNIDLVIPTRRGVTFITKLFEEAAQNPDWMRHTFIIVVDTEDPDHYDQIKAWYRAAKEELPLPWLTLELAHPEAKGNVSRLRQQGLELGHNAHVYFQDDDDPLPKGLENRIRLMKEQDWDAVYGVTETTTSRGQLIERFPPIDPSGNYTFDPVFGSKLFPTYLHPSSALFRRTVFEKYPFFDGTQYHIAGNAAFFVRLLNGDAKVTALPDTVRRAVQHEDNVSEPIMPGWQRNDLAEDVRHWLKYVKDSAVAEFHEEIAQMLESGEITTFKEIDAIVEDAIDSGRFLP